MYDPYAHNDDDGKDHPDSIYEDMAANYLADDCTERCGLCDARVDDNGLCPHCDNSPALNDHEANAHGDIA